MTAAHLPAYLDHRDAVRKAATTRAAVVIAVGDAIELHRYTLCENVGCPLICGHVNPLGHNPGDDAYRALVALDAALPHLDDDGIRAVADALLGPEGTMP